MKLVITARFWRESMCGNEERWMPDNPDVPGRA